MSKQIVVILKDHTVIVPETKLEIWVDNKVASIINFPEERTEYKDGQTHSFRSKKEATAFCRALNGDKLTPIAQIVMP